MRFRMVKLWIPIVHFLEERLIERVKVGGEHFRVLIRLRGKDILSIGDLSKHEIERILHLARELKEEYGRGVRKPLCEGRVLGLLFQKPSTRTRVSFESAMMQLGGRTIYMRGDELQLKRGEPIKDTARVLDDYLDALVIRAFDPGDFQVFAEYSEVPIINGLSDLEHPTQILCDLFTVLEVFNRVSGLKMAWVGDGNNVCNSWLLAAGVMGIDLSVACPRGYEPDRDVLGKAMKSAEASGATIEVVDEPSKAVLDADVLYTDVWVSMGQVDSKEKAQAFQGFQVNSLLLEKAKEDAVVMHCLPAHRGQEIAEDVLEGPRSIVFQQSENKLHGAKGILASIF